LPSTPLKRGEKGKKSKKCLLKPAIYKGFGAGGQIKNECPWKPLIDKGFQIS